MQILINRGGLFRVRARMSRSRSGNTLNRTTGLSARPVGNLFFRATRLKLGLRALIFDERTAANSDAKPFALEFKTRQSIFGDYVDQFAELGHVNRSFQMSGLIAMPPPPSSITVAIAWSALRRPRR